MQRRYTVDERLTQHGTTVEQRLRERFVTAGLRYPAQQLAYVSFKDARRLEVYGRMSSAAAWTFVTEYSVLRRAACWAPIGGQRIERRRNEPKSGRFWTP
jgi:hypothetical protein